tara:strand:- start:1420 stop:1650 length:231 start_codon:yes stop_codon:yes gene_type:complete
MIKVWLMVMFMSSPDMPSVKYQTIAYKTEEECLYAKYSYLDFYAAKPDSYKATLVTDAHCIEFESFPIKAFNNTAA